MDYSKEIKELLISHTPKGRKKIELNAETRIIEDVLYDSLKVVVFLTQLEDKVNIPILDHIEELIHVKTIGQLEKFLVEKESAKQNV